MAARTQSSKKCFQTGTGTNSAFYMYERRYATEPFTAIKPPAQSIGPSGGAAAEPAEAAFARQRGLDFAVDNVQERRQLWRRHGDGCASRRRIIRYGKTWAWQVGVSDPLAKGAGPTFAPRRGVAHAPVAFAAHWWDERHGRHRAPSVREWLRHLQSLDRATYDCELLLASEAVG